MKFTIFICILIEIIMLRYEYIYNADDIFIQNIGYSLLKSFMVIVFLFVSSVWLSYINNLRNKILNSFLITIVSILPIFLVNFYKIEDFINDFFLMTLMITYACMFFFIGVPIYKTLASFVHLKEGEIEKAFLNYPPNQYFDFILYILTVLIVSMIPQVVLKIWS